MNTRPSLPPPAERNRLRFRRGFSLVEVLAAMTVLAILVLMVTRIFNDSAATWKMGERRIDNNANGRAALAWMQRELGSAIVDDVLSLKIEDSTNGLLNHRIWFVALNHKAAGDGTSPKYRDVEEIEYELGISAGKTNNLYRRSVFNETSSLFTCCTNASWWALITNNPGNMQSDELISTATGLRFWGYDTNGDYKANYDSRSNGPPAWIDVALYSVAQDDIETIANGAGTVYRTNSIRPYVTRVYLHNTQGYQAR